MDEAETLRAAMCCPTCDGLVTPLPSSTFLIAWYNCPICGASWSARLRNGLPAIVWQPLPDSRPV